MVAEKQRKIITIFYVTAIIPTPAYTKIFIKYSVANHIA